MAIPLFGPLKTVLVAVVLLVTSTMRVPCAAQSDDPIDSLERESIALIYLDNTEFGVGFVVASDANSSYLLTAAHVLGCADTDQVGCRDTVKVRFVGQLAATTGTKVLAKKDVKDGTDLALVKIDQGNLKPVAVLSRTVTDDEFYVIGFSQRIIESSDRFGGTPEVHDGNVSRIFSNDAQNFIEVSVPAYPGFSGGPIVDKATHAVVGVFSGHLRPEDQTAIDYQGVGPALVLKFLADAEALTHVPFVQVSAESKSTAAEDTPADPISAAASSEFVRPVVTNAPPVAGGPIASPLTADSDFSSKLKAAERGDPVGELLTSLAYQNGIGVEANRANGLTWLQKAADAQYAPAVTSLALDYESGTGVPQDGARALALMISAAKLGDVFAAFRCGQIYHYGKLGTKPDDTQSQAWYSKAIASATAASSRGDGAATWALARAYGDGIGVPKDPAKGLQLLELASNQGSAGATNNLALTYLRGRVVPKDTVKGIALLEKSAQLGGAKSALRLSEIYLNGRNGLTPDEAQGEQYLERAAALGSPEAMRTLGLQSLSGNHAPLDVMLAGTWFRKSAALNYLPGETQYARWLLETGPPAARNSATGLALMQDAADRGWNGAQCYLGDYY